MRNNLGQLLTSQKRYGEAQVQFPCGDQDHASALAGQPPAVRGGPQQSAANHRESGQKLTHQ
jgi:hypothetical protein